MRSRKKAFLLVMVLFLIAIIFTMGMGFLGSRVGDYQSTNQSVLAAQARALARAGLEDARTKFNLDSLFPPAPGVNETYFTYSENVYDSNTPPNFVGCYKVTIDGSFVNVTAPGPLSYYTITSTGGAVGVPNSGPATNPAPPIIATHCYRAYMNFPVSFVPPPDAVPNQVWISTTTVAPRITRFDDLGSPTWGPVSSKGL